MRHVLTIGALLALSLALSASATATPGNGKNTVYIFNDCDGGVGEITLVSQASASGLFATAHLLASNRPAPLISLDYEVVLDGVGTVDSGSYSHPHPQQGQPIVSCTGHFDIPDGVVYIEVTGFFPAGT
jgi:hypothetical protein